MLSEIRNRKGFTLIELMVVVGIIGILATIAIQSFQNVRLRTKFSESKANIGAIRSTEVAYFAEWNFYVANQDFSPLVTRVNRPEKMVWNTNTRFSILGFHPEGQIYFSYGLSIGTSNLTNGSEGYSVHATSDLDNNGLASDVIATNSGNEPRNQGDSY